MNETIVIMGMEWKIVEHSEEEDERLLDNLGYCDVTSRLIVISDMAREKKERMAVDVLDVLRRKVIRHEIIHAFLSECGLRECSEWAQNEEMIDWFAIQIPRLNHVFRGLECFLG